MNIETSDLLMGLNGEDWFVVTKYMFNIYGPTYFLPVNWKLKIEMSQRLNYPDSVSQVPHVSWSSLRC